MKIDQILLFMLSITAVFLTQQAFDPELAKYAPIVGLISQPFWLYASYTAKQWGIFSSSILYTGVWCMGIYNNFF